MTVRQQADRVLYLGTEDLSAVPGANLHSEVWRIHDLLVAGYILRQLAQGKGEEARQTGQVSVVEYGTEYLALPQQDLTWQNIPTG